MVAFIKSGKEIRGALNYNENKVREGMAILHDAVSYQKDLIELTFKEKLFRLQHQADLNTRIKHKCVHISINFDIGEEFSQQQLLEITKDYMELIGFGKQPYLVYQHLDAAHPHLHIVTTSIDDFGKGIRLHKLQETKSYEACRKLEEKYDLVKATEKRPSENAVLETEDLDKAVYGKSKTKNTISNIVRSVVSNYKYSSLFELNAVLKQFNVVADRGEEGTAMYKRGGLCYSMLNEKGEKVGIPIKSSSIYSKPTLERIAEKFAPKKEQKTPFIARTQRIIDDTLRSDVLSLSEFILALKNKDVHAELRQNKDGKIYGITYVDNKTRTVFNGSDLGAKKYSIQGILSRLANADSQKVFSNKTFCQKIFEESDYKKGFRPVLANWLFKGIKIIANSSEDGDLFYKAGHWRSDIDANIPMSEKLTNYLKVNGFSDDAAKKMNELLEVKYNLEESDSLHISMEFLEDAIQIAMDFVFESSVDSRWKSEDKKRRRRSG